VARKTPLTSLKQISEINLTPLMDLTFILLITFIITFPLIEQGIPIDLPKGKAEELEADRARTISLDKEGELYLDDSPVTLELLAVRMSELKRASPDAMVLVRADERLRYGRVVDVLKLLHETQIARMALVTEADEKGR